jgi:TRAP-type mannitol/chloroaromatic compound transport system permease small subunit
MDQCSCLHGVQGDAITLAVEDYGAETVRTDTILGLLLFFTSHFCGLVCEPRWAAPLAALDIMQLSSPQGGILSAVIFNALIIIMLVPLALRGVAYRPLGAAIILRKNKIC